MYFKCLIVATATTLLSIAPLSGVKAGPESDALVECVSASTTDADIAEFIKVYALMLATHPSAESVVSATPGALEDTEAEIGEYLERILLIDCLPEVRASLKSDNGRGINLASLAVMQPVFQSLQTHIQSSDIGKRMFSNIEKKRIEKLLGAK